MTKPEIKTKLKIEGNSLFVNLSNVQGQENVFLYRKSITEVARLCRQS